MVFVFVSTFNPSFYSNTIILLYNTVISLFTGESAVADICILVYFWHVSTRLDTLPSA